MAVTNPYYEFTPVFVAGSKVRADAVNDQFTALQNAFDNLPGDSSDAIVKGSVTFAGASTGAGNAYEVTMPDTRTTNADGDVVVFEADKTNTGAATLKVDAIGAVALVDWDGTALTGGEIVTGRFYQARYDAGNTRFAIDSNTDVLVKVAYAQEWATGAEDTLVSTAAGGDGSTDYSSTHWALKSKQWSLHPEDTPVPTTAGGNGVNEYSAYHWAEKARLNAVDLSALRWEQKTASYTMVNGDRLTVEATGATATIRPPTTLVLGDFFQVHNETTSTQTVQINPQTGQTIRGGGTTVTSADNMVLAAGETAFMVASSTTELEMV
jgi:hypothetical protein